MNRTHVRIGKRHWSTAGDLLSEDLNHRPARAEYVAEATCGQNRAPVPALHVGGGDQTLGHQLGGAHDVRRIDRLVRRGQQEPLHSGGQCRLDDVLRTDDVGLDRGAGRSLAQTDMLERSRVNDDVNAFHQADKTMQVADVGQREAEVPHMLQLMLEEEGGTFIIVDRKHVVYGQMSKLGHDLLANGSRRAGDEHRLARPWARRLLAPICQQVGRQPQQAADGPGKRLNGRGEATHVKHPFA